MAASATAAPRWEEPGLTTTQPAYAPVELYGGHLDGKRAWVPLDEDGQPPLERIFNGFALCDVPYRLATRRRDGVYVYVPLFTRPRRPQRGT